MPRWPADNQADLIEFYGMPKTAAVESQLVDVVPPFRMTYDGKPVRAISFHRKAAPALAAALNEIWEAYGRDQSRIDAARVSVYSGAYNPRYIRGTEETTKKWSNHAYGASIDFDAEHNGLNAGHGTMPQIVIDAFKRQGARWGGDYRGRTDPMHFEFCGGGEMMTTAGMEGSRVSSTVTGMNASQRERFIREVLRWEDDGSVNGRLKISHNADGTEIAGVTSKNHPEVVRQLEAMVNAGDHAGAIRRAGDYIMSYTEPVTGWGLKSVGTVTFVRDCYFNRGPTGSAIILQRAGGVEEDGDVGDDTKTAARSVGLMELRAARESYERTHLHRDEQSDAWKGLKNRWNAMLALAQQFEQEIPSVTDEEWKRDLAAILTNINDRLSRLEKVAPALPPPVERPPEPAPIPMPPAPPAAPAGFLSGLTEAFGRLFPSLGGPAKVATGTGLPIAAAGAGMMMTGMMPDSIIPAITTIAGLFLTGSGFGGQLSTIVSAVPTVINLGTQIAGLIRQRQGAQK